jgi:hypothetical protein
MAGLFSIIESVFFLSVGVTFLLIIAIVYFFKQRLHVLEQKSETMISIVNQLTRELAYVKPVVGQLMSLSTAQQSSTLSAAAAAAATFYMSKPEDFPLKDSSSTSVVLGMDEYEEDYEEEEEDEDEDIEDELCQDSRSESPVGRLVTLQTAVGSLVTENSGFDNDDMEVMEITTDPPPLEHLGKTDQDQQQHKKYTIQDLRTMATQRGLAAVTEIAKMRKPDLMKLLSLQ